METSFWVKINAVKKFNYWHGGAVEIRKSKPDTKANEVAVKITINIPDAYFETPELSATITVPENAVNKPFITPEVQSNIGEMLTKQLGMRVFVETIETEQQEGKL